MPVGLDSFVVPTAMARTATHPEVPIEAYDKEALVKRNPHADFPSIEAARPPYPSSSSWTPTKSPNHTWIPGTGAIPGSYDTSLSHISIDPAAPERKSLNYKLMISTTVPRPIALVSTISSSGVLNLAPYSYFNNVTDDPPIYSLSFHGEHPNDSLRNVLDNGELCISIVSDWFLEAANFTSVNSPPHISEWALSGLHPLPSKLVKPPHVGESAFSIECKVHTVIPVYSKTTKVGEERGMRTATLVLVEAVMFHAREDALDTKKEMVDIKVLRPVWRGGGITYGSCFDGFETPRPEAFRNLRDEQVIKEILGKEGCL